VGLLLALTTACAHADSPAAIGSPDALRAVHESYRRAWLANDAEGVLRVFTPDAVLLPHHGLPPVVGLEAIRAFWFAPGPPTTITVLELEVDEASIHDATGIVRGRSRVEWTVQKDGTVEQWANAGTFLSLLRRGADGAWRITHHMWDDPPNRQL